ncbi:hypothetical protein [Halorussus amylolyticus]|uniref:hypothetical protein n=1 Tax=Halorussus amylolyticus TaxID=1126242 RepID=UPI00104AB29A|nr:hypothetical protein [Halorussus amylolyticus]
MHLEDNDEWERLARKIVWLYILDQLDDLEAATRRIAVTLRDGGTVTATDIEAFRNAHTALQTVVEEDVLFLVDDIEPYQGALHHVPYEVFADYLDISLTQVNGFDCEGHDA